MSNRTIVEEVYLDLENKILNFTYEPGRTITEQEISKEYNISRTPCRDVFQKLKMSGLVKSVPFKSNHVALLDLDLIRQNIYMRTAIEFMVIKDTIRSLDEKIIADLEYNLKLQEILLKSNFLPNEFYKLDCEFHKIWFKHTDNLLIWDQIQKSQVHYNRFRMLDIVAIKDFEAIYEDHKLLVEIIKEKNYEELENRIRKHLNSGITRLKDKINEEFSKYFIQK